MGKYICEYYRLRGDINDSLAFKVNAQILQLLSREGDFANQVILYGGRH
jgi:hypothetical protein